MSVPAVPVPRPSVAGRIAPRVARTRPRLSPPHTRSLSRPRQLHPPSRPDVPPWRIKQLTKNRMAQMPHSTHPAQAPQAPDTTPAHLASPHPDPCPPPGQPGQNLNAALSPPNPVAAMGGPPPVGMGGAAVAPPGGGSPAKQDECPPSYYSSNAGYGPGPGALMPPNLGYAGYPGYLAGGGAYYGQPPPSVVPNGAGQQPSAAQPGSFGPPTANPVTGMPSAQMPQGGPSMQMSQMPPYPPGSPATSHQPGPQAAPYAAYPGHQPPGSPWMPGMVPMPASPFPPNMTCGGMPMAPMTGWPPMGQPPAMPTNMPWPPSPYMNAPYPPGMSAPPDMSLLMTMMQQQQRQFAELMASVSNPSPTPAAPPAPISNCPVPRQPSDDSYARLIAEEESRIRQLEEEVSRRSSSVDVLTPAMRAEREQKLRMLQDLRMRRDELRKNADGIDERSLNSQIDELRGVQKAIKLCILMDITGSMASSIRAAKEKCAKIYSECANKFPDKPLKIAFVGYRDIEDGEKRFLIVPFVAMEDMHKITDALSGCSADGGGDTPEDIAGAMDKVLGLDWRGVSTRVIVHIADAPAHGRLYHDDSMDDNHPDGDPEGRDLDKLVETAASRRIDYYFAELNDSTRKMIDHFRDIYKRFEGNSTFSVISFDKDAREFLPLIVKSVTSSIMRNEEKHYNAAQ